MGEFLGIAERLARIIEESKHDGGLRPEDIPNAVGSAVGCQNGQINCYPGVPGYSCCDLAMFVSLNSPSYTKGRGHLSCRQALEKIVQHMQGNCLGKTRNAVFLTDSWDHSAYDDWKANIRQIKTDAQIEAYLLTGKNISEINL